MTTDPSDFPRDDLESLLDGRGDDLPSAHLQRLANLLAAAAAPGGANELRGERDALAAFRAVRDSQVAAGRETSRAARTTSWPAKIAVGVAALASVGTTAVAMASGSPPHLHVPTQLSAPSAGPTAGPPSPGGGRQHVVPTPSGVMPSWTGGVPGPAASATRSGGAMPSGSPSPTAEPTSVTGLCRAYLAITESRRRQALQDPKFAPLVTPAGGKGKVDGYCTQLLASPSPSPAGSLPSFPTTSPSVSPEPSVPPSTASSAGDQPPSSAG